MLTDSAFAQFCAETYIQPVHSIIHSRGVVHFRVYPQEHGTVLAIQGTQSKAQAIADAHAMPSRAKAGWWAHSGFLAAAEALEHFVWAHLPPPLVITGHSLGAAVAVALAGLMRSGAAPDQLRVVGFGCPRVGLFALRRLLADVDIRLYRNGNDVVPCLAPPFPIPYRHVRPLIQIGEPCLNPIRAHGIAHYQEAVQKLGL